LLFGVYVVALDDGIGRHRTGGGGADAGKHAAIRATTWHYRAAVGDIALPISIAVFAHGQGRYAEAVAVMRPIVGDMYRLGGSHAQQDVLEQVFLDSAMKAGLIEDARSLLERVAGRHPVPPRRRRGYAMAAGLLEA
jgi:hypothetical protein